MPTPVEIVTAFIAEWDKGAEGFRDAVTAYFTPDAVWENVGLAVTTGPVEANALMDSMGATLGVTWLKADMLAIAAVGDKVLTERIDHLFTADGTKTASLRLMGIFEVKDGRIAAWRDYFDTAALKPGG
jgi:limonene-1,2-epoxide hydrolase